MSRKHTAKEFDKSNKWLVIGVDLAKYANTIVGITEDGEVQIIERISTEDLLELASEIQQTTFAMEPCNGANILSLNLQAKGHEVKTILGAAVKDWVKVHLAGQKTDRNDALALAHLSRDTMLKPIRTKTVTEMRMQSIYAARKQLVKCRTSILVSLKGMSQAWGILFSAQRRNLKKMRESLEDKVELLSQPVVDALIQMIDSVARLDKEIDKKVSQKMMWGKMIIALAAKLARILWALLKYDANFNLSKAGLSRSMLAQQVK